MLSWASRGHQSSILMDPCSQILAIVDLLWTNEPNLANLRTDSCRLARGGPEHLQCSLAHSSKASAGFGPEYEVLPYPFEMDAVLEITSSIQKGVDGSCFILLPPARWRWYASSSRSPLQQSAVPSGRSL